MRALILLSAVALFSGASLLFVAERSSAMRNEKVVLTVKCSDVPKNAKLIGSLGFPLGEEALTIRGSWKESAEPTKDGAFKFVVTSINGKAIAPPIELSSSNVEPLKPRGELVTVSNNERKWSAESFRTKARLPKAFDGDEWEMLGFEAGHTAGLPREILNLYKREQQRYGPGTFVTVFRFARVRMFGKPHVATEPGGNTIGPDEIE